MTSGLREGGTTTRVAQRGNPRPGYTTKSADRNEGEGIGHRIPRAGRNQLLPSVERHDAIGDSRRLSDSEDDLPPGFRPGRFDRANLAAHGIAAAAASGRVHGPPSDAIFPARRHD